MERVFISYAMPDREISKQIRDVLQEAGSPVWLDEYNIKPGDDWRTRIDEALQLSTHLVVILSPNSIKSPYIANEYRSFLSQNKQLIPVLVGDISDAEIPPSLQHLHYVDLRKPSPDAMAQIIATIRSTGDVTTQNVDKHETSEKKSLKLTLNLDLNKVGSEKLRDIVAKLAEAGVEEIEVVNVDKAS